MLTGMSPLSSRLSSPLRASSCDIGGGVSYSQRNEEEKRKRRRRKRGKGGVKKEEIVQPWPQQCWLDTSETGFCMLPGHLCGLLLAAQ